MCLWIDSPRREADLPPRPSAKRTALAVMLVAGLMVAAGCSKGEPVQEIHAADTQSSERPLPLPAPGDWPSWRGPDGNSRQPDAKVPTHWGDSLNIVWKADLPGRGHSSPIVRGGNVFVATADENAKTQSLVCVDRSTGKPRWVTPIHTGGLDHAHEKNTQASATPACDGDKVYVTFLNKAAIWLTAVRLDGQIAWQREVGPFSTVHGYAASPALWKGLVIVAGDSNRGGFLAAIDRASGEIVWRIARKAKTSFSSPIVGHVAGRDQVLICGCGAIDAYDPGTGRHLWYYTGGPTETTSSTVAFDGDRLYASGGYPGNQTVCLKADGTGDVTATHVVWKNDQKFYVPSLLVHDGRVYAVNDGGVAYCFDAATGRQVWVQRLNGDFSSSPVLAGKHIYVTNEAGRTFVFKPGDEFVKVAENDLNDGGFASPAASGQNLFLRTGHSLVCIGEE